jgi:NTP pyrophosphatase (non-canonical NTP hydrolase)
MNIEQTLYTLICMTRDNERMPDYGLAMKLAEECGEVNTAVLKSMGYLQHKTLDEDVMHEVADVINVCIGLLTQHYLKMDEETILNELNKALCRKGQKYKDILGISDDMGFGECSQRSFDNE